MFSTKEPILLLFDRIDHDDHMERILFYEENTEYIFALSKRKRYYFTFHYIISLFESGKYEQVLSEIDEVIEYVFLHEVQYLAKRTYEDLLYKKAMCHYQMLHYEQAVNLGKQLIGMHPDDTTYRRLTERSIRAHYNFRSSGVRLTALILIFCSAIISAIIWFINTRGRETSLSESFLVVISPCLLALVILGGASIYGHAMSIIKTDKIIALKKEKKKGS